MAQSSIDALQKLLISNDNKEKVRYNTPSYITKRRTNETVVEGVHYRFDSSDRALIFKKLINTYGKDFFHNYNLAKKSGVLILSYCQ
jgi:hypothetical protein